MKRFFKFILTVMMLITFAGCGKKETDQIVEASGGTLDLAKVKVGICIYRFDDDFMKIYRDELERCLIEKGYQQENITILDSNNDQTIQNGQVDTLIKNEVDVLIVDPVDSDATEYITDTAHKTDLPLIYIHQEPAAEDQERWKAGNWKVTYVGADSKQSGSMQGELIADIALADGLEAIDHNDNGAIDYVMIEGNPNSTDAHNRTEESIKYLSSIGFQMRCLADEVGNWETAEARRITNDALNTYGTDVEVIFCNNDTMALGALESMEERGRVNGKDIFLVGVDALEPALQAILDGRMTGTVYNDYLSQSHAAVDAATNYLARIGNDHFISCDYVKVSSENAAEILEHIK